MIEPHSVIVGNGGIAQGALGAQRHSGRPIESNLLDAG
jgi:hypothetical protein